MRRTPPIERPFLFVLPVLGLMGTVAFYPLVSTFRLSLRDELPIFQISRFVGFSHYVELWYDQRFWHSLSNTLYFAVVSVSLEVLLGLGAALLLHQIFPGRGLVRALVLSPWFIPTVVAARMWEWMYNPQLGVLNFLLQQSGLFTEGINWLGQPSVALHAAILADVWKTAPFAALLILAGLQTIPPDLYQAARVDGARSVQAFWHITLPLLTPVLGLTILFRMLDALRVFDIVYVLTGGGPANTTETLSIYAYRLSFQTLQFGLGAAVAVVIFGLVLTVSLVSLSALRRLGAIPR
jgi:multiple sugar transport system permease protein